jgi:hypothetical protein
VSNGRICGQEPIHARQKIFFCGIKFKKPTKYRSLPYEAGKQDEEIKKIFVDC